MSQDFEKGEKEEGLVSVNGKEGLSTLLIIAGLFFLLELQRFFVYFKRSHKME